MRAARPAHTAPRIQPLTLLCLALLSRSYSFEKKPLHYIPGYTGHLPLNRERFGINYREASADTIAMQRKKGVHHPVVPLDKPAPNYVSTPA